MKKKLLTTLLCFISCAAIANTSGFPPVGFESPEHLTAGSEVFLQFTPDDPKTNQFVFTLANGVSVTYAQIMMLGGDFYGIPNQPIALGDTPAIRVQRFLDAYNTLAVDPHAAMEEPKLMAEVQNELDEVNAGIKNGEDPATIYGRVGADHSVEWNCITGGFCVSDAPGLPKDVIHKIYVLKQGRYLKLADTDFDHFAEFAESSYVAGHAAALQKALEGYQQKDTKKLEEAYAMNAFASHYLSDAFASGHMRTPHYLLYKLVTPATLGSLLTNYMHNEDNQEGLNVVNDRGDHGKAYGDRFYLDARNEKNRDLLRQALQASADEIYLTFSTGNLPSKNSVSSFLPNLDLLNRNSELTNTSALFYWDDNHKQLLRRTKINDIYNYDRTATWVGWETLLELIAAKGLPGDAQVTLLMHDDTRALAIKYGLIDKNLLSLYWQLNKKK